MLKKDGRLHENRRMKPVEIVLRRGRGRIMYLRYIISTCVNVTMYSHVQLLYANNFYYKFY
jgi:hypothetical protein